MRLYVIIIRTIGLDCQEIIRISDCYVGMRDNLEFIESKNLFDLIIWVDASERLPIEVGSFNIDKKHSDIIVNNNGSYSEFESRCIKIGKILFNDKH